MLRKSPRPETEKYNNSKPAYHVANILIKIFGSLVNGLALKLLWGWFGAPLFETIVINYWHAVGISMTVRFLTTQQIPRDNKDLKNLVAYTIYNPALAVFMGYIIYYLMIRQ
jgi:hypothetical protein